MRPFLSGTVTGGTGPVGRIDNLPVALGQVRGGLLTGGALAVGPSLGAGGIVRFTRLGLQEAPMGSVGVRGQYAGRSYYVALQPDLLAFPAEEQVRFHTSIRMSAGIRR